MSIELGRRLINAGAISPVQLKPALMMLASERVPLVHALLVQGAISSSLLEQELSQLDYPTLNSVVVHEELAARLPSDLCRNLLAVPVRIDPLTSTVDVAAVDPSDPHVMAEFLYHLGYPVRLLRAQLQTIEAALDRPLPFPIEEEPTDQFPRSTIPFPEPSPQVTHSPQITHTPAFGTPVSQLLSQPRSDAPIPLIRKSKRPTTSHPNSAHASDLYPLDQTKELPCFDPAIYEPTTAKIPLPPAMPRLGPPFVPLSPSIAPADLGSIIAAIKSARSRDQITNLILQGMRLVARRVAVFAVKKDCFIGWSCSGDFPDPGALLAVRIPSDLPSALSSAVSRGWFLGPLPSTPVHAALAQVLPQHSGELSIVCVRIAERAILLIMADELGDTMIATRTAETLASAASESLARLLRPERT